MNLIQLLTDQRSYEWITHSRWGASWSWRWRWVGDDEERRSPSPEPQMDSNLPSGGRTGLGGGSVSWIAIILSPWFFSGIMWFYSIRGVVSGATRWVHPTWARQERGRALVGCAHPGAPLRWILALEIIVYCIKNPRKVSFHSKNFYFCTKTTPCLLKTVSVRG